METITMKIKNEDYLRMKAEWSSMCQEVQEVYKDNAFLRARIEELREEIQGIYEDMAGASI